MLAESFPAVPRASGPVFLFCAPELILDGTEGVGSHFHVLLVRTHFRRYRGRRVPFLYLARSNSLSTVPRASGPVFMFSAPRLVFGGSEGKGSHFHALRSEARFRRYVGRWVSISCFALPDSFSAVPRASGPVFMFYAPELIFDSTEGVSSRFHVLRCRTDFQQFGGCRFPFSCFACPNSFSAVPRASGTVFMF
jgi:hypothetical protein